MDWKPEKLKETGSKWDVKNKGSFTIIIKIDLLFTLFCLQHSY